MKKRWLAIVLAVLVLLGVGNLMHALLAPSEETKPLTSAPEAGLLLVEEDGGLMVLAVRDDSAAARSGFHAGDLLLSSGDTALTSVAQLESLLLTADPLPLTLSREEALVRLDFRLR